MHGAGVLQHDAAGRLDEGVHQVGGWVAAGPSVVVCGRVELGDVELVDANAAGLLTGHWQVR